MRTRNSFSSSSSSSSLLLLLILTTTWLVIQTNGSDFSIIEATVDGIHKALPEGHVSSRELVDFYMERIERLNPVLRSVLEVNPDTRREAEEADRVRRRRGALHGIPVMVKDGIATNDKMNNTAGSYALMGSKVARDAHVVDKLRRAGAIILDRQDGSY